MPVQRDWHLPVHCQLDSFLGKAILTRMIAKVSVKGQMVIPEAVREQARIRPGDEVDIGYANGLVVLRKRRPLTASRVRSLLLAGNELPDLTSKDEETVAAAIRRVRTRTQP